ncbi:hypothetical protein [Streptomyces pseudovenezuelae]|uniref:hypothetical protein n=1 Tax=Streptomyces pseudovenezuelae TaxID=67350 RepID=UPI003D7A1D4E
MKVERELPSSEARELLELTIDIADRELAPRAAEFEETERFPREVFGLLGEAVDEAYFADVEQRERELAERLRSGCRALPEPDPAAPFEHAYTEMPAELRRQLHDHLESVALGQQDGAPQ